MRIKVDHFKGQAPVFALSKQSHNTFVLSNTVKPPHAKGKHAPQFWGIPFPSTPFSLYIQDLADTKWIRFSKSFPGEACSKRELPRFPFLSFSWFPMVLGSAVPFETVDRIIVETDSFEAICTINGVMKGEGMPGIVLHILDMMQRGWLVTFQYVKRDENFVVDRLVKLTFENDLSLRLYVEAPS
ncbi:hypothetical protein V6N13_058128 [Hibiscus sabdariffa]